MQEKVKMDDKYNYLRVLSYFYFRFTTDIHIVT